jgi:hypothetical protein
MAPTRRPFAGRPDEAEWVALREVVPCASAVLDLAGRAAELAGDRPVTLATVLPLGWAACAQADGSVWVAAQAAVPDDDVSRGLAAVLLAALELPPGDAMPRCPAVASDTPALTDLLEPTSIEPVLQPDFGFWLAAGEADPPAEIRESLERANAAIQPTERLAAPGAAFLTHAGERGLVRWVLPYDEDTALDALARLAARDGLRLATVGRFLGTLRTFGVLIAVWETPVAAVAAEIEPLIGELAQRLLACAGGDELTPGQRRARAGLLGRQLTVR